MKRLSRDFKLEKKLYFTGYRQDVSAMMAMMDVVVHASNEPEPFGMVIIEAMALGKPVVATRAGGPLDIIQDGQTGFMVEMGDSKALGEAVAKLLLNQQLCRTVGIKGRTRVKKLFSNQLYAQKMERLFLQIHNDET